MGRPPNRGNVVVTPEAVALSVDVAGLGSRGIAIMIDMAIQAACLFALTYVVFASHAVDTSAGVIVYAILAFVIFWGYFPIFEGLWHGQTPGKRTQRLRVIRADGQPCGGGANLTRNLVRIVDWLPSTYAIGIVSILLTGRSQRLGDLAAGTIVVRERRAPAPNPLPDTAPASGPPLDTAGLDEREYDLVRSFLERRASLDPGARAALAAQIAAPLRAKVPGARSTMADETFLELLARSYRQRFAQPAALPAPPGATPARPDLRSPS